MGGTASSLLVFFSSTNPHYLLAKPDSKGLSTANLPPSCSSGNVRPNLAVPIPYTGIPPKQTLKLRWFDPPYWIFHAWIKFRMAYQHCLNQFCAFSIYHLPEQVPPNSNSQPLCTQKNSWAKMHHQCIFTRPKFDHCLPLSVTHSIMLSKRVEVVAFAEKRADDSLV